MNWIQPINRMNERCRSEWKRPGTLRRGLILTAVFAAAGQIQAAEPARATNEFVFPKSVFVYSDLKGKDPFYPNRPRAGTVPVSTNVPKSTGPNLADFQLRGITGPPERRIALINNLTFTKGEEQEVRAGNAKAKIRVVEIGEKTVKILIEGQAEPKELVLPERLIPLTE
jgi:hypothetical protein